jgi:hypothetical protein
MAAQRCVSQGRHQPEVVYMRVNAKVLAGLGAASLIAFIGVASTASNTVAGSTAGYGTNTISGATASSVSYTLSADGTTIVGASIVFAGNLTGKTVTAGFNAAALGSCTLAAYDGTALTTTATCSGLSQTTAGASSLAIAVK